MTFNWTGKITEDCKTDLEDCICTTKDFVLFQSIAIVFGGIFGIYVCFWVVIWACHFFFKCIEKCRRPRVRPNKCQCNISKDPDYPPPYENTAPCYHCVKKSNENASQKYFWRVRRCLHNCTNSGRKCWNFSEDDDDE